MPQFTKYQGLGNDFIIVEAAQWPALSAELARRLCDRRFGIGADGVLALHPAVDHRARMVVHNADGSISEMCGNGLRCVARYLTDRGTLSIDTGAGPMTATVDGDQVEIAMTPATVLGSVNLDPVGLPVEGIHVNTGNPHCVIFGEWTRAQMTALGPQVQALDAFPQSVNVSFATVKDGDIDLTVFERGVGFTMACGTGAVATAVAAWTLNRASAPTTVKLPGGALVISGTPEAPIMRGPALEVFRGQWTDPSGLQEPGGA